MTRIPHQPDHRRNAGLLGLFYLTAAASSIIAVALYAPVMGPGWLDAAPAGKVGTVLLGGLSDLLLVVTAIGTAAMLYPYLRPFGRHMALWYCSLRFMEAVFVGMGLLSSLVLISLSAQVHSGTIPAGGLQGLGAALQQAHRWVMVLGPNLMLGLNTLLYSILLLRSRLVPPFLARFGMLSALMVLAAGLLDMFGFVAPWSPAKGLIALPVGAYEISLALYLIVKGFDRGALARLDAAPLPPRAADAMMRT